MSDIDITERLRHEDLFNLGTDHEYQLEVAGRAAEEIEALRADRDRIAEVQAGHAREIERLHARLDEALGARDHFRAEVDRLQKCFGTIDRLRKHISKQNARIAELECELGNKARLSSLLQGRIREWEESAEMGHPDPCTLGPLCPYCEIERQKARIEELEEAGIKTIVDLQRAEKRIAELAAELERLRPLKEAAFNYEELKSCQAGIVPLLFAASEYATRALNEKADNLTWDPVTEGNSRVDCVVTDEGVFWKPGEDEA